MHANVGDRLLTGPGQAGVIGVPREGGVPPYIVRWQSDGHISMVFPDEYARIVAAGTGLAPVSPP
jgi:hypothetical protein